MRKVMSKKGSSISETMKVNWSAEWKFATKLIKASSYFLLHEAVLLPLLQLIQSVCSWRQLSFKLIAKYETGSFAKK